LLPVMERSPEGPFDPASTSTVWIDGECSLCTGLRDWAETRDRVGALDFRDFRGAEDRQLPRQRSEHEEQLWVVGADRGPVGGYDAVLEVLRRLPGWSWLAAVGSWSLLLPVGRAVYRLVARHRPRGSGDGGCGCPGGTGGGRR
jgi:predicted DCC family thiol-disulfide oxidoreductase YuxK